MRYQLSLVETVHLELLGVLYDEFNITPKRFSKQMIIQAITAGKKCVSMCSQT